MVNMGQITPNQGADPPLIHITLMSVCIDFIHRAGRQLRETFTELQVFGLVM